MACEEWPPTEWRVEMASIKEHPILHFIRSLRPLAGHVDGSDGLLLAQFVACRDEAAFAVLVRRHGPMVFGVCARVLGVADAEDAFQATFLVLARKAAGIRDPAALGSWLYGVACRTALKVRSDAAGRRARERRVRAVDVPDPADEAARHDLRKALDDELSRLPDKYRAAVVLCCLEGHTHEEAARRLGCPRKTVTTRLTRACERLRGRLTRRGLALSAGALALLLAQQGAKAAPVALTEVTIKAATLFAAGEVAAAGSVSALALTLTKEVLKAMWVAKLKTTAILLASVMGIGAALGVCAMQSSAAAKPEADNGVAPKLDERSKEAEALKELEGDWKVVELVKDGRKATEEGMKEMRWNFKGSKLQGTDRGGKSADQSEVKLDPSKEPPQIDFVGLAGEHKGETAQCIYKLEKGRLTVCWRNEKRGRPTEFTAEKGSDRVLITLEKVK